MTSLEELTKYTKKLSVSAINTLLNAIQALLASDNTVDIANCPYCSSTRAIQVKTIACIARYKDGEWYIIDDNNHQPVHVLKIDSYDEHSFAIHFDFTVKNVLTFICSVDETYADYGYQCGASVSLDCALIYVHQIEAQNMPEEAYARANIWIYGIFEVE